jgi:hypothetical protein
MGLLGVLVLLLVIGYRAAPAALDGFETVQVQVRARAGAEVPDLHLLALADWATDRRYPLPSGRHWLLEKRPVTALGLVLPADWRQWLDAVEVRIGARSRRYAAAELAGRWQRGVPRSSDGGSELWWAPAAELATPGIVARRTTALNAPGDAEVLPRMLAFPALLLLSLGALMAVRRGWAGPLAAGAPSLLHAPDAASGAALAGRTWLAFGVGVVVAALILAERIEPYYFSQGDNLTRLLPIALDGCSRLDHDAWPDFDPYQMLGMPMASAGVHGLSYPLLWLSCTASDGIPGLRTALYEVYGAAHLLLGFLAAFWLGRREALSPALATAFGLSFALAGIFLIAGRSWAYMLPAATWLPLLLVSARSLETTLRPFRWVLASGLAIGLLYHAGNRELWFFGVLAWALTVAVARAGGLSRQRLGWALAALLLGLAVAMPLLVAESRLHAWLAPQPASGHGIWHGLAALLLPYPLVDVGDPEGWGAASGSMSQLYYSGTLLTLAGATATVAALAAWLRGASEGGFWRRQRWSLLAVLAFLLCLGGPGFLWSLFGLLPLLQRDTYPFELLALLVLALNLNGALALQRLLPGRGVWHMAVALPVALLLLLHVGLARQSFGRYADDPYPAMPAAVAAVLQPTEAGLLGPRLVALAQSDDAGIGYMTSLPGNVATYYRLMTPDGGDMAVMGGPEMRRALSRLSARPGEALRAFGVRWALVYRAPRRPDAPLTPETIQPSAFAAAAAARLAGLRPIATSEGLELYDLGPSDPIAFVAGAPQTALSVRDAAGGVTVALPDTTETRQVVLNFVLRPGLEVSAGGTSLPLQADAWGRAVAEVPAGSRELRVGYALGWGRGLYYGIVLALAALALLVLLLRFGPDDFPAEPLA